MKIAIIGDRGIPARYSGFSTLVEELAVRLVADHKMEVTVYGRTPYFNEHPAQYKGVDLVWLSAPGGKSMESVVHTNRAVLHAALRRRFDLVFIVDPGNGPFCLPLKMRGVPVVYHTDGLGWKRTKWSPLQRRYYKWSEKVTSALADWLVTDSRAMVSYYRSEYNVPCSFIPYGSIVGRPPDSRVLAKHGLTAGGYFLVVARIEPENNTLMVIREYKRSGALRPLVVVGSVPYDSEYARAVAAESDARVKTIGSVFDSGELNGLWQHCYAYLHAHEVGGTNPSLLRAMGAGAACIPLGVEFNREVVGPEVPYFTHAPGSLSALLDHLEARGDEVAALGAAALVRSRQFYRWDAVATGYAGMFRRVCDLHNRRATREQLAAEQFYSPAASTAPAEDWERQPAQ